MCVCVVEHRHHIFISGKSLPLHFITQVDLAISVDGGETTVVTFTGVGFDKRVMGDTMPLTDQTDYTAVPCVQRAFVPGQVRYLYAFVRGQVRYLYLCASVSFYIIIFYIKFVLWLY